MPPRLIQWAGAAAIVLTSVSSARAADQIQVGLVALDPPTLNCLGIVVPITAGDDDYDAQATVRFRRQGTSSWLIASPLLRVRPDTVGNETPPENYGLPRPVEQFAGSIFGLAAGTTYEIQVEVIDPDGGGSVQTISGQTRSMPASEPLGAISVPVSNDPELASALAGAVAGQVVDLAPGTYRGPLTISRSGTAEAPILVRGSGSAEVFVDATGASYGLTVSGSHVYVEGITVFGSDWGARLSGAEDIAVRKMRFTSVSKGIDARYGTHRNFYICDNLLEGKLLWPNVSSSTWNEEGIVVTGEGHVVCHNTLSGFGDALGLSQNTSIPNVAIDFFGNEVLWSGDDGLEIDYGHRNIRVFDNRVTNSGMGVSVQPSWGGPIYIFRNVLVNQASSPYKFNNDPTGILVYNNTSIRSSRPGNFGGSAWAQLGYQHSDGHWAYVANFKFINNLAVGATSPAKFTSDIILGEIDYNGWSPDGEFVFFETFADFADVQARSPFEANGLILEAQPFAGFAGLGPDYTTLSEPADVRLSASSNAVDAGLILANINDDFRGGAPDLGAWELGKPVPVYGVRNESSALPLLVSLPDTNADGVADVAVVVNAPIRAEIRSGVDGSLLNEVPFHGETMVPLAVRVMPDSDGNGVAELLVLAARRGDRRVIAEIRNATGPSLRRRISFAADLQYVALAVTGTDASGNGVPELAVLRKKADGRPWAQVKDAVTAELVGQADFDPAYTPFGFEVVEDLSGVGVPELAVLGIDVAGRVRAQVKDTVNGALVARVYFDSKYVPSHSVGLDLDGDGAADALAVLGEDAGGVIRAQVKDVATGNRLATVRFQSGFSTEKMVAVPDLDGSGTPELAVLQRQGSTVRVQIKDAITGQPIKVVPLSPGHEPQDLIVLPDVSGNGKAEVAYLGEGPVGSYLLQVKDALTAEAIFSTTLE